MSDDGIEVVYSVRDDGYIRCAYDYDGAGSWSTKNVSGNPDNTHGFIGIAAGDVDTSGSLDVVGATWTENGFIAWWEFNENTRYWDVGDTIATGLSRPLNVAVADIDGDEDSDVAATVYGTGSTGSRAVWYENTNGVGTSWTSHTIDTIVHPYAIALDTLNQDDYLDVVVTSTHEVVLDDEGVYIYYGSANHTFSDPDTLYYNHNAPNAGLLSPRSVRAAHFNNDIYKDLIIAFTGDQEDPTSSSWAIYIGYGGEDLQGNPLWDPDAVTLFPDFKTCRDTYLVDLNEDGNMDFVASALKGYVIHDGPDTTLGRVDVFLNDEGDWTESFIGDCRIAKGLSVADFDGDGWKDVVCASYNGASGVGQRVNLYTSPGFGGGGASMNSLALSTSSTATLNGSISYSYSYTLESPSEVPLLVWYKLVTPDFRFFIQSPVDTLGMETGTYSGGGTVTIPDSLFAIGDHGRLYVSVGYAGYDDELENPPAQLFGFSTQVSNFEIVETAGWDNAVYSNTQFTKYDLVDLCPNPFNPSTSFAILLPEATDLSIMVYNMVGQRVKTLADNRFAAGRHEFEFDGSHFASGLYFLHASAPGHLDQVRKLVLLK